MRYFLTPARNYILQVDDVQRRIHFRVRREAPRVARGIAADWRLSPLDFSAALEFIADGTWTPCNIQGRPTTGANQVG